MSMNKVKAFDLLYISIVIVFILCALFMPKTGKLALLDVAFNSFILWSIALYLFLKVRKLGGGIRKNLYVYAVCLILFLMGAWNAKNLALDLFSGPQEIVLYNVKVSKRQGSKGITSLHYYLDGEDEDGNRLRIEISGDDYTKIGETDNVLLTYYKNAKRLYKLGGAR
jgi:hypothetical protein